MNPTVDFGLFSPLSLGNYVWFDVNNNGLVDAGETGVNGVSVELYRDTNSDGVFTPGLDAYVGAQTTANGGYYSFTSLLPGDYLVVITSTNFTGAGALVNYQNSTPTVTGNSD
jgi:hypothetical protein